LRFCNFFLSLFFVYSSLVSSQKVSLHVLYFVAYANENYVFGSRAFRDAADAHWQDLEQLESMVGLRQVRCYLGPYS